MTEWLALGLIPLVAIVFLAFSAWAEGRILRDAGSTAVSDAEPPKG